MGREVNLKSDFGMYAKEKKNKETVDITSGLKLKDDGQEKNEKKVKKQKRISILNGHERDKRTEEIHNKFRPFKL